MTSLQPQKYKPLIVLVLVAVLGYLGLTVKPADVQPVVDAFLPDRETATPVLPHTQSQVYQVVSVIDGDTFVVVGAGEDQTVRVLGIDTPETKFASGGEECYGAEASDFAREVVSGQTVTLTPDPDQAQKDVYGRTLAYVELTDGRDFGELMITKGFAREYTYKGQSYRNQSLYQAAEETARASNQGLWQCGG